MKPLFLIAAALIAAPAFAQTTPAPADPAMAPQTMPAPTDPAMAPAPAGQSMGTMTTGGYQPAMPAMQGTPTPGVAPTFQAAPTPAQAFPAPAPLAKYPICKKGQFDQCMQRGGR